MAKTLAQKVQERRSKSRLQPAQKEDTSRLGSAKKGAKAVLSRLTTPLVDVPDLPGGAVGNFIESGLESVTSPIGLAATVLAPVTGGTSLGLTGLAGTAATVGTRLAAEAAVGAAAGAATKKVNEVLPENTPGAVRALASLGAGAVTGGGLATGINRASRAAAGAEAATQAEARAIRNIEAADPASSGFVDALIQAKKQAQDPVVKSALKQQRTAVRTQRFGQGIGEVIPEAQRGASAEQQFATFTGNLKGKLPALDFPKLELAPEHIESLYQKVAAPLRGESSPLRVGDALTAKDALDRIFLAQEIPAPHEMRALEKAFGPQVTEAIGNLKGDGIKRVLGDVINLPRAVIASFDLSQPLNQGLLSIGADPVSWAKSVKNSAKAFANPKFADEIDLKIRGVTGTEQENAISNLLQQWGSDITGTTLNPEEAFNTGKLGKALFGKNLAGAGINASERGFQTAGNYQRWAIGQKVTKQLAQKYGREGDTLDEALKRIPYEEGKKLSDALNLMTGRTGKNFFNGDNARLLNAFFFAPNFLASRFLYPANIAKNLFTAIKENPALAANPIKLYKSDPVLALQARSLGGFVAQGVAGLAGLKAAADAGLIPGFKVNTDPTSSDFGKGHIGRTRYDFWGGYQPIVRSVARLVTGHQTAASGAKYEVSPTDVIWNQFVRSKAAPVPGLAWNAITGTNMIGDKVDASAEGIDQQAEASLIPLFLQDVISGYQEAGLPGALAQAPSFLGQRATTYSSPAELKNSIADQLFSKPYLDLTGAQRTVVDNSPELLAKAQEETLLPTKSFGDAIQTINDERKAAEDVVIARLQSGQSTRRQTADSLADIQKIASGKRAEAVRQFGIETAAPNSLLQQALQAHNALYDQADLGYDQGVKTNQIDWDKFNQLEADLYKRLSPEQVDFIEAQNPQAHDSAEPFYANRRYISQSKYYDVADDAFSKYASIVKVIDPEIDTYGELLSRMDAAKAEDPALYKRLNKVQNKIDAYAKPRKERLRKLDPKLDAALYLTGTTSTWLTPSAKKLIGDA